jgi:murein L,D-transpeptidase YcbB/YkuD
METAGKARETMRRLLALTLTIGFAMLAQASEPLHWISAGKPTRSATLVLQTLARADEEGLRVADYALPFTSQEMQILNAGQADPVLASRFDRALSAATARYVTHLQRGRVDARAAGFKLPDAAPIDAAKIVRELTTAADVTASLAALEPPAQPYRTLKQALIKYRALAARTDLAPLPPLTQRKLEVGDEYAGAESLRALLTALGDFEVPPSKTSAGTRIDEDLAAAIAHFQARHGLQPDGVLGGRTYTALATPLEHHVRQIELTMERWRWLSALPRPNIVINIPQFMLYALPRPRDEDQRIIEIPVIVGKTATGTPIFSANIEQVIFQPYWDVPASITRKELLPKIRKNTAYLDQHHFEIVRGQSDDATHVEPTPEALEALAAGQLRLRQKPGPDNALGPVKFVLPNPHEVRLHGTAEPELFDRARRAFSHGCIRVSDPAALAEYVLKDAAGDWNEDAVEAAMCGTQNLRVVLKRPVSVIVFYATAAATVSRGVLFVDDIYGYDSKLQRLLDEQARAHN